MFDLNSEFTRQTSASQLLIKTHKTAPRRARGRPGRGALGGSSVYPLSSSSTSTCTIRASVAAPTPFKALRDRAAFRSP
ncbi:hypothetical protein EVAR_58811_1 [Eumeta japonica]|uniref:Uncharacterized protein n=1 Tax=Eumeta variegata TaxID=151549 RepID=A0A4C1YI03_EUMVA|nr:hypothetical protein EVAR_58811_1 [Eumeta japonica]